MGKETEGKLINEEAGMEICGGNREIYLQILTLMLSYEGENGQMLSDNCKNHNWETFGNQVHALKSSAAGIGAMALSEAARSLETAVDEADYEFVMGQQEGFFKLLKDTVSEIHDILDA